MNGTKIDLRNVDCYDEIKQIETNSIDFIYFNPPFGITGNDWDKSLDYTKLWEHFWRVLKPKCCVVIHSSGKFTYELISTQLKYFKYKWFWNKMRKTGHLSSKYQPLKNIEEICVFYKRSPKYNPQMKLMDKPYSRGYNRPKLSNTNYFGVRSGTFVQPKKKYTHSYPTHLLKFKRRSHKYSTRPDDLCEYIIKTYTDENDVVLDITMSDSQVGKACKKLKRNYIGFEINSERFNDAKKNVFG